MNADLLTSLPTSLTASHLGFLDVKDVVRLESACCNHFAQKSLHESIQFPACVFSSNSTWYVKNCVTWLVRRQAKVDGVIITDNLEDSHLHALLNNSGSALHSMRFFDPSLHKITTAYHELRPYVAQLTDCVFAACFDSGDLHQVLAGMRKLERLHVNFVDVAELTPTAFLSLNCPHLRSLMVACVQDVPDWQWNLPHAELFTTIGHNLLHLRLSGMKVSDDCAIQIAQHCPNLTVLDLTGGEVCSPDAVAEMCSLCPLIAHLELETASDRCILRLDKLKLQTLTVKYCAHMSDTSTEAIIEYFSETLTSLSLVNLSVREQDEYLLMRHMTKLKRLEFGGEYFVRPTYLDEHFISFMSHIVTLSLISQREYTQQALVDIITRRCKSLVHLRLTVPKGLSVSLTKMVKKCSQLRTLQLHFMNVKKAAEWKRINPKLEVKSLDEQCDAFDSQYYIQSTLKHQRL